MDLATPAPRVSGAAADMADDAEAAAVEPAVPKKAPLAEPAAKVMPAVPLDDPMKHAPKEQINEKAIHGDQLTVDTLRGTSGSDFEAQAAVLRGVAEKNCLQKFLPCIFDERDFVAYGEVLRFVLVKSSNCFVYTEETDLSPLYSIPLADLVPKMEDRNNPEGTSLTISPSFNNVSKDDLSTVLLKYPSGGIAYQFTFNTKEDKEVADRFISVVARAKTGGEKNQTASVAFAVDVGKAKEKCQPEDPNSPLKK